MTQNRSCFFAAAAVALLACCGLLFAAACCLSPRRKDVTITTTTMISFDSRDYAYYKKLLLSVVQKHLVPPESTKMYKSSTMKLENWLVLSFSWMFPLGYTGPFLSSAFPPPFLWISLAFFFWHLTWFFLSLFISMKVCRNLKLL